MYTKGYEYFMPDAGECEKMSCLVCGEDMECKRNCSGPTSFVESMAGGKGSGRLHDSFWCKYAEEDWHIQVLVLREAARKSPSKVLEDLMTIEYEEILKTRTATKKVSKSFF